MLSMRKNVVSIGVTTAALLCGVFTLFCRQHSTVLQQYSQGLIGEEFLDARIVLDTRRSKPSRLNQFGVFFEEIFNAGEGGLYAELVQDRSFEGLAFTQGFLDSKKQEHTVTTCDSVFDSDGQLSDDSIWGKCASSMQQSWFPRNGTLLRLTKARPLNSANPVAAELSCSTGRCSIINAGFWGISARLNASYHLSVYLRLPLDARLSSPVTVTLESANGSAIYASAIFSNITDEWTSFTAHLTANATDHHAVLAITTPGPALEVDVVSLFPQANGVHGSTSPFRTDLLQLLKDLKPGFLRFPGGCYVEGTLLSNAFYWKPSVGPIQQRPGHWNGMWQYWSTDGLGLYEYMLLSEELEADAIWVMNNGLSHAESLDTAHIMPMVQDALDSVAFVTGPADTEWGSVRAAMGHPKPWKLPYFAIGNEDCGKPFYATNYIAFATALRIAYPELKLIANCDMGEEAEQDLFDWHWYTDENSMFQGRNVFDFFPRDKPVFVSEYAVFDHGISTKPAGNLGASVAEAGFMTGLERNSDAAQLAAFAPLLTNYNASLEADTCPTSMIIFDNHRAFVTPSYWVQKLFMTNAGSRTVATAVATQPGQETVAASTSCLDQLCNILACKLVNYSPRASQVSVDVEGMSSRLAVNVTTLTGESFWDTNSFAQPNKVAPSVQSFTTAASAVRFELSPYSLTILNIAESTQLSYSLHAQAWGSYIPSYISEAELAIV